MTRAVELEGLLAIPSRSTAFVRRTDLRGAGFLLVLVRWGVSEVCSHIYVFNCIEVNSEVFNRSIRQETRKYDFTLLERLATPDHWNSLFVKKK